jgi:uncharacterized protein YqeY
MSLKQQLTDDMKAAMKGGEKDRLGVIRLINAALKQREVDERIEITDAIVLAVLEKMVKQRKDSITQYEAGNREDLAAVERYELGVIQAYLPAQMDAAALEAEVLKAIAESGAKGAADMGKVMGVLKPRIAGKADMGQASAMVKQKLAG